ncbi:MAG TPA: methyltransferase domain-containing protein [Thermoleophilaceae bacterium]|nr:methyltransferase domain-containing protein [Thermoleophilaceae bacterium]
MSTDARAGATVAESELEVRIPSGAGTGGDQDEEWCEVHRDGEVRRVRFHDYAEVFSIPGLYERLFHETLDCDSPRTVCSLLDRALRDGGVRAGDLTVLDVGAGNGMVGEQLALLGAGAIVGIDIIEEAAVAARRDRPGVYEDYRVLDLTDVSVADRRDLRERRFNCLTTVAALGFGDIPPAAFETAYDLVEQDGWVAFNIKEEFVDSDDASGFAAMIRGGFDDEALELVAESRYQHRLAVDGEPIHYVAMVARKRGELAAVAA